MQSLAVCLIRSITALKSSIAGWPPTCHRQSPFDLILRTDAYLLKHQYRGNEETTIPGLGYGIGTRLNWANGFFVQAQYEGLFYKDEIKGAAGGEVKTLIHHPSIQLGIAH